MESKAVSSRDIKQKLKWLPSNDIQYALERIYEDKLFKDSDWSIDKDSLGNFTVVKDNVHEKVLGIIQEIYKEEVDKRGDKSLPVIIRSWMVRRKNSGITEPVAEKVFWFLYQHGMLPPNFKLYKIYYKWSNVILAH